jgi:hypothetical protein
LEFNNNRGEEIVDLPQEAKSQYDGKIETIKGDRVESPYQLNYL